MRRAAGILTAVIAVVALVAVGFLVWAHTLFAGERGPATEAWLDERVEIRAEAGGFVIEPADGPSHVGLVFLPGARVEPAAYLYKLSAVAEAGVTVVVPRVALNLAIADTRSLEEYTAVAPDVEVWAVGGHSLGGVRACMLAEDAGALVLFGSYCANDLSDTDVAALVIGGSADGLSTPAEIDAAMPLMPETTLRVEIEGANHADFGDYGPQPGDGVSTRSSAEVRAELGELVGSLLTVPWAR